MTLILFLALACSGDDEDPRVTCESEGGAECCSDSDCDADSICHFSYSCYTKSGDYVCTEPTGDKQCHELCDLDTGDPFTCSGLTDTCQSVEHAQGEPDIGTVTACF